jgi:hypothetical protein
MVLKVPGYLKVLRNWGQIPIVTNMQFIESPKAD